MNNCAICPVSLGHHDCPVGTRHPRNRRILITFPWFSWCTPKWGAHLPLRSCATWLMSSPLLAESMLVLKPGSSSSLPLPSPSLSMVMSATKLNERPYVAAPPQCDSHMLPSSDGSVIWPDVLPCPVPISPIVRVYWFHIKATMNT